ncbi:MAG: hypothetical protein ACE5E6_00870, partial [Phycisphaerae bacterium]
DAAVARTMLGLDYRVVHTACPSLRLLQLACVSPTTTGYEAARTFRAQSPAELSAERPGVSTGAAPPPSLDARETMHDARSGDGYAAALAAVLRDLAAEGHRRLGVYGAGRFTIRHADVYRESRVPVVVVLDDRPARHGERFLDWPIGRLADARQYRVDAIVVSTDRFTRPMLQRARRACGTDITVRAIDTHRDPTCGNGVTATSARRHGDRPTEEPAAERPNNVPDTPVTSSSPDLVSQR